MLARKNSVNAAQQLEEKVEPMKFMHVYRVYNHLIIEGLHEIKPLVTLAFMSNSPLLYMYKKAKCNLLGGESCHLSDVT